MHRRRPPGRGAQRSAEAESRQHPRRHGLSGKPAGAPHAGGDAAVPRHRQEHDRRPQPVHQCRCPLPRLRPTMRRSTATSRDSPPIRPPPPPSRPTAIRPACCRCRWCRSIRINDPQVLVEAQSAYREPSTAAGSGDRLVQAYTDERAHTGQSAPELAAALDALMRWIEKGVKPTAQSIAAGCERCAQALKGRAAIIRSSRPGRTARAIIRARRRCDSDRVDRDAFGRCLTTSRRRNLSAAAASRSRTCRCAGAPPPR